MSRRDTIVIAVLINMGLLVVLFVGALKPATPIDLAKAKLSESKEEKVALPMIEEKRSLDQVDNLLSKYVEPQKEPVYEAPKEVPFLPEMSRDSIDKAVIGDPPSKKVKEVIVRQGDVLAKIAKRYETSIEEIMKLNRLNDSRLQIGQILYVPANSDESSSHDRETYSQSDIGAKYYTVKNGDNPWTIAIKNGIKVEELLKLNNLDDAKAKKLKPGDKLRIR